VCLWDDRLIVEACLREVERGGQVFFIHNRVETICTLAEHLKHLLPELKIGIAHGQLPASSLERIMLDFLGKQFDVLLTTTIVESGVDVPNANTMIVNRADRFGLAQLHQLRGRVGRSDRRAYCYFLMPRRGKVTLDAHRRLRAIRTFSELGSGFQLALRDLEIRGSGNILGAEQHGRINAVGFELYSKLLEQAVSELRGETTSRLPEPTISLNLDLFIPQDYVPYEEQRIAIYKKLADARNEKALGDLRAELEDRFGPIPGKVENLFDAIRVKLAAVKAGAESVVLKNGVASIQFPRREKLADKTLKKIVGYPVEFVQTEKLGVRLMTLQDGLSSLTQFLLAMSD
jgi:transcription-repair coupling factor (superfamily II helicase)